MRRLSVSVAFLLAGAAFAQEPQPSRIHASYLNDPSGISLALAWRFAPGDGAGRELPQFDDDGWRAVRPQIPAADLAPAEWPGVGWFRRHLLIDPALQHRPVALRLEAPGVADVYLDGRLVLSSFRSASAIDVPFEHRDTTVVRFDGNSHTIAVRYVYPRGAPLPASGFGFLITLDQPGTVRAPASWIDALQGGVPRLGSWIVAVQGAIIALPFFLALLHLALFSFDRRARENLFYAIEMIVFAEILLHDFGGAFIPTDQFRVWIDTINEGGPPVAIFFGLLTYYAVRTERYPKSWRLLAALGGAAFAASYAVPQLSQDFWTIYFVAVVGEVLRLELRGRTVHREGASIFLGSFALFCLSIVLQILINFGVVGAIGGVREVYLFGILSSAVGMSVYLARRVALSRVIQVENARKTQELAQARELQLSMLPVRLPEVHGLEIAASTQTATEVGGDYYDVRCDGDGALLLAFGDATGHGLASGIVVTAAKALFNGLPPDGAPREMLTVCDDAMRAMNLPGLRMCLSLARLTSHELTVASAAMPPILIYRAKSGSVDEAVAGGLPLGGHLSHRYEEWRTPLCRGDTLLFASDGFAELLDAADQIFGYERATNAFREAAAAPDVQRVIERLEAAASQFRGSRPPSDDITFVVARVTQD